MFFIFMLTIQAPNVHVTMMKQSAMPTKPVSDHGRRLEQLEQQLADILDRRQQVGLGTRRNLDTFLNAYPMYWRRATITNLPKSHLAAWV